VITDVRTPFPSGTGAWLGGRGGGKAYIQRSSAADEIHPGIRICQLTRVPSLEPPASLVSAGRDGTWAWITDHGVSRMEALTDPMPPEMTPSVSLSVLGAADGDHEKASNSYHLSITHHPQVDNRRHALRLGMCVPSHCSAADSPLPAAPIGPLGVEEVCLSATK
jgi:hypothetical protein